MVLVVDDDPRFRALVRALFDTAALRTCEASSGEEALALAATEEPGVVLLDIDMPTLNGYVVFQKLRERFGEELPIVFMTGVRTESYDRAAGFVLGADDYFVKPFDPSELLARVARLLAGKHRPPRVTAAPASDLTAREAEVLTLLVQGLDQRKIAGRLFISENTVAKHIQHILSKLGVHTRAQAVALAARTGLVEMG
jgi:two-component system, NarL family, nitrate/nitrite response regulator NarL